MEKEKYKKLAEKYLAGVATPAEIGQLAHWMRTDPGLSAWWEAEMKKNATSLDSELQDKVFARIKREIQNESVVHPARPGAEFFLVKPSDTSSCPSPTRTDASKRRFLHQGRKWAAIICLPLCMAVFATYWLTRPQAEASSFVVKADKGNKVTVLLPDQTEIILNADSRLTYESDFGKEERRVVLEGEGYFKVAHKVSQPFIVEAGGVEVKVTGTVFNVSAYAQAQDITVVLLEGKVGLETPTSCRFLHPGDKVKYNKHTGLMTAEKVYAEDYVTWTKGYLYFENESLTEIMHTLSRVYNIPILIESPRIAKERFTGTIPGGNLQNALDILTLTASFKYEISDSQLILTEK